MVREYHGPNGHEQTLGDSGGRGSLAGCSPWGLQRDATERLNNKVQIKATVRHHYST